MTSLKVAPPIIQAKCNAASRIYHVLYLIVFIVIVFYRLFLGPVQYRARPFVLRAVQHVLTNKMYDMFLALCVITVQCKCDPINICTAPWTKHA